MAAATQALPVGASTDFQQSTNLTPFNMMVKQEIVDPSYTGPIPPPQVNGQTLNGQSLAGQALLQKVKKAYTRKPKADGAAGPPAKARKVKKEPTAAGDVSASGSGVQSQIGDHMPVQKKKRDRFKGTTEEEVLTRVLPDHIKEDLDILIVGINPGLTAAYVQHHYAGPGNHFWKCLYLSGMIPQPMNAMQDAELMNYGIGFTNIVARTTRGSADLSRKEIAEGGEILKGKMLKYLPKIALFNGKGIYEVFCGNKNFYFGLQPEPFPGCPNTCVFVNPSSSARCTQLPRAVDKVPFYEALKRVRDHIRAHGSVDGLDRSTVTFPDFKLVTAPQKNKVKEEPKDVAADSRVPPQNPSANATPPQPAKKPAKPRKPRASKKKDSGTPPQQDQPPTSSAVMAPQPSHQQPQPQQQQTFHDSINLQQHQYNMQQQQSANHSSFNPVSTGNIPFSQPSNTLMHSSPATPAGPMDFMIKQEVTDPRRADQDLDQVLRQNFGRSQADIMNMPHAATGGFSPTVAPRQNLLPHNMVLPTTSQSSVKQERPDWAGYGVMPNSTTAPPVSTYPHFPYWPYIGCPTSNAFMPYQSIPNPQMPHPQVTATLNSPAVAQPAPCAPVAGTYSSPQEASSPAMSSQSNLTQASLDSLPKADSASTVANWLQNIPNMSLAQ